MPPRKPAPPLTLTRPHIEPGGKITAIVGVTGCVDEVDDIVVPGAFVKSLQRRRPKGVKAHDWKLDVARVPYAEEWMPGDPRLPKLGPDGKAWPREAGALVMTFEYNLKVGRAADEYEMVKFYAETGEACFSIGYKVASGKASKRSDGVRMIYELELFEGSSVLFGAHPLTMALAVKDADDGGLERKYTTGWWAGKTAEKNAGKGSMIALYPDPDVAKQLAHPDGSAPGDLHITLAFLPDNEHTAQDLAGMLAPAAAACPPLAGQVGGIGQFPAGDDGTPTFVPVDVPHVHLLHEAVKACLTKGGVKVADNHGFTPHMTLGYNVNADPVPATKVAFDRMHAVVGDQKVEIPFGGGKPARVESKAARMVVAAALALEAKGLPKTQKCAHCDAQATKRVLHAEGMAYVPTCDKHLGKTKSQLGEDDVSGVRDIPPVEGKAGNADGLKDWYTHGGGATEIAWGTPGDWGRCVALAGKHMTEEQAAGWCNLRHHDATGMYPATHAKLDRGKSAEARMSAKAVVQAALSMKTTETKTMPYMPGSFEYLQDQLRDAARDLLFPPAERDADVPAPWLCLTATYPDHIVVDASGLDSDGESYSIPYTVDETGAVSLGTPQAVDVIAVVIPEQDAAEDAAEAGADASMQARYVDPTVAALKEATARVGLAPLGGKALEDGVRDALLGLLDELAVKGADVTGMVMGDDNTDDDDLDRMRRRDDTDPLAGDDDPDDEQDHGAGKGLPPKAPAGSTEDDPEDMVDGGSDEDTEDDATSDDGSTDPTIAPDVQDDADAAGPPEPDGDENGPDDDEDGDGTVKLDPEELHKTLASLRP